MVSLFKRSEQLTRQFAINMSKNPKQKLCLIIFFLWLRLFKFHVGTFPINNFPHASTKSIGCHHLSFYPITWKHIFVTFLLNTTHGSIQPHPVFFFVPWEGNSWLIFKSEICYSWAMPRSFLIKPCISSKLEIDDEFGTKEESGMWLYLFSLRFECVRDSNNILQWVPSQTKLSESLLFLYYWN